MINLYSLRSRLLALTAVGFVIGLVAVTLTGFSLMSASSKTDAETVAQGLLREYANTIRADIMRAGGLADNLATVSQVLVSSPEKDRNELGHVVENMVADNPTLLGVTLVFEPNALDGKDAEFVGHRFSDAEGGRFATYAYRDGSRNIEVEKLDMNDEAADVWYKIPFAAGKTTITPSYIDEIEGTPTLITTIAAPVRRDGRVIGVAGVDFALADISKTIAALKPFHTGNISLIDGAGQWLANPDKNLLGQKVEDVAILSLGDAAKRDGKAEMTLESDHYQAAIPIVFPGIEQKWLLVLSAPEEAMVEGATIARDRMLMISGAILVVALTVAFFAASRFVGPISRMTDVMKRLADGDFSVRIPFVDHRDEIGDMARSVEVFHQAAVRNRELEADATANRERAEKQRLEAQRLAEAEAAERLSQATASLAAGLQRLSSGDMLCEIDVPFAPSFEALRHDFNLSVQQLREVLANVGDSVAMVNHGAQDVSAASDDLARRTEQQATSIEETAAALEQITVNVTSTSSRTSEARDRVRTVRTRAEQSREVVRSAVAAMERIEQSSQRIGQIIGVIEEIAFQTNLLALNAGVEAARAGEAGKGFAVVAQEVRDLAQRSANAAKEIQQLVKASAVAVDDGVKLVGDTGSCLNEIEQLVHAANADMEAVATAASEQSAGIAGVNSAINHMDRNTQQNATMVEEMNATGSAMARESLRLQGLLAHFRLRSGDMPSASRRAA